MEVVHSSKVRPPLPPGPFLVVGLARSGVAAAVALKANGEAVSGVDSGRPGDLGDLDGAGIDYSLDCDGLNLLDGVGTIVKSPGVPNEAPVVEAARSRGVVVIGELELGWLLFQAPYLAITGTNGKTTTTEMAAHIFRAAGHPVAAAGNVGNPLSSLSTAEVAGGTTVVCECSSFQLEDTRDFSPEVAVFLNLAPDHLDRHGDFDSYREAKLAIFRNQVKGDIAVLNGEDPELSRLDPPGEASLIRFHPAEGENGFEISLLDGTIQVDGIDLVDTAELQVFGKHNVANAMAAAAGALSLGLSMETVASGLRSFGGVAHRLESINEVSGVGYINDSKATNVEATRTALASFEHGVHLILGGSLKREKFEPLLAPVIEHCRALYLIGDAADAIESALSPAVADGIRIELCGDLPTAVALAAANAELGETVLLSPACASFGEFRDYEDRGDRFRDLVGALDGQ
ncbi:MAG: UDP-N-acetylmuramoyl-L-alanine--D-glutamate ligase [Solirubrobacterales bacterium]